MTARSAARLISLNDVTFAISESGRPNFGNKVVRKATTCRRSTACPACQLKKEQVHVTGTHVHGRGGLAVGDRNQAHIARRGRREEVLR